MSGNGGKGVPPMQRAGPEPVPTGYHPETVQVRVTCPEVGASVSDPPKCPTCGMKPVSDFRRPRSWGAVERNGPRTGGFLSGSFHRRPGLKTASQAKRRKPSPQRGDSLPHTLPNGMHNVELNIMRAVQQRAFRKVLLGGRAGPFPYSKFVEELTAVLSPPFRLNLADFLTSGLLDMVLFRFQWESFGREGKYKPGLAVRIGEDNVEEARRSPIPTRHAVAHGLVSYSSQQSSLNAIFIADCVFSAMFGAMGGTGCSNCPQIPCPTDRTNRIC